MLGLGCLRVMVWLWYDNGNRNNGVAHYKEILPPLLSLSDVLFLLREMISLITPKAQSCLN